MTAIHRVLLVLVFVGNVSLAQVPPVPVRPAPIVDIVVAQPFELAEAYEHLWRLERPRVKSGYLLVLRVDRDLVYPRQLAEPVLYVGHQTAERLNVGYHSGHVVAIVPANIDDPTHPEFIDLGEARIFFGSPAMPERVDTETIAWEHRRAVEAGIEPIKSPRLEAARRRGGRRRTLVDKRELVHAAMMRVAEYSPQEQDLVGGVLSAEELEGGRTVSPQAPSRRPIP